VLVGTFVAGKCQNSLLTKRIGIAIPAFYSPVCAQLHEIPIVPAKGDDGAILFAQVITIIVHVRELWGGPFRGMMRRRGVTVKIGEEEVPDFERHAVGD